MLDDVTPEKLARYNDLEKESIKAYMEHDLVRIDCMPSFKSFRVMEDFVESRPDRQQRNLYAALSKRHPFREFKFQVERMGLLQEWYDYKNAAERDMAEEWLKDNDLEIVDGKIVRKEKPIKLNPEYEKLFDSKYLDDDCRSIANNIGSVLDNIEDAYKAGAREIAINQMLQLALANCNHFISDEHWCYFDDMYDPDYCYDGILQLIAKDMKADEFPMELNILMNKGFEQISQTECVDDYGCLDLEQRLMEIFHRL